MRLMCTSPEQRCSKKQDGRRAWWEPGCKGGTIVVSKKAGGKTQGAVHCRVAIRSLAQTSPQGFPPNSNILNSVNKASEL